MLLLLPEVLVVQEEEEGVLQSHCLKVSMTNDVGSKGQGSGCFFYPSPPVEPLAVSATFTFC